TAPRRRTSPRHGRRSDGDGRGSIVSRGSLFQDQLLEREVRHSLAQPVILFLEFFQPLHLIALQAAELLAPAIIRELRHADRANRLANRSSLRQQNIDLAQLRDDLFGLMLLLGHSNVLSNGSIAYFREDHFSGGRPPISGRIPPELYKGFWYIIAQRIMDAGYSVGKARGSKKVSGLDLSKRTSASWMFLPCQAKKRHRKPNMGSFWI